MPLHPSGGGANILPLLLVVSEKRGGLVLTHKSRLSPLPTSHNLLLVCTCEMIGGAPPTQDTNLWHNITHIMDIEDISCYSFRVRNMIAMQIVAPAARPPHPVPVCVVCGVGKQAHVGIFYARGLWYHEVCECFRGSLASSVYWRSCSHLETGAFERAVVVFLP